MDPGWGKDCERVPLRLKISRSTDVLHMYGMSADTASEMRQLNIGILSVVDAATDNTW